MQAPASFVVILDPEASDPEIDDVVTVARAFQPNTTLTRGDGWAAIALGDAEHQASDRFAELSAVRAVVPVSRPYRLACREVFGGDRSIELPLRDGDRPSPTVALGGGAPIGIVVTSRWAGSNEARLQLLAPLLAEAGCSVFDAGRMATVAERGTGSALDLAGLERLRTIVHEHGLALSVEVVDPGQIGDVGAIADILQVGSGSMQDFSLLREMGRAERPVLIRRGYGATVEEFLLAAEYVLSHGNGRVILCESGIRTFDSTRKPRFEINAIPLIKRSVHLPLLADPSHSAQHAAVVPAMARAAVAAGADGLILDVGTEATEDPQGIAIDIDTLRRLTAELRPIARAIGRTTRRIGAGEGEPPPATAKGMLQLTDRTLAQTIEAVIGLPPTLEVVGQWRLEPPASAWLSPPLSPDARVLGRCTSYRMGAIRLSRHLSYVDLGRIDPTLAALLETKQLNLGQLFVDPRIEKLSFEFGTHEDAGRIDDVFREWFPEEVEDLHPYVWRRYRAAIGDVVTFVVIEALPVAVWDGLLRSDHSLVVPRGSER